MPFSKPLRSSEEIYELLRGEISGALKRLQLLARNVELYREAVRGRVAAEEGRRLAEEANLLKSRFLATVSHELRTPLGLIVGASEMILREQAETGLPPRLLQDAESIRSSARAPRPADQRRARPGQQPGWRIAHCQGAAAA